MSYYWYILIIIVFIIYYNITWYSSFLFFSPFWSFGMCIIIFVTIIYIIFSIILFLLPFTYILESFCCAFLSRFSLHLRKCGISAQAPSLST